MDLLAQYASLEKRTAVGLEQVKVAATESRDGLGQRIDQAQVDLDQGETEAKQGGGEKPSKWAQMKADASAKREDIKAKVHKRNDKIDADMAATDADIAEAEAADAISYAEWVVDNARLAVPRCSGCARLRRRACSSRRQTLDEMPVRHR